MFHTDTDTWLVTIPILIPVLVGGTQVATMSNLNLALFIVVNYYNQLELDPGQPG